MVQLFRGSNGSQFDPDKTGWDELSSPHLPSPKSEQNGDSLSRRDPRDAEIGQGAGSLSTTGSLKSSDNLRSIDELDRVRSEILAQLGGVVSLREDESLRSELTALKEHIPDPIAPFSQVVFRQGKVFLCVRAGFEWERGRLDGLYEGLSRLTRLPLEIVWTKDPELAEQLAEKRDAQRAKKASSRLRSPRANSAPTLQKLPSIDRFRAEMKASTPSGIEVLSASFFSTKLGPRRFPFAVVRISVDEGDRSAVSAWEDRVRAKYGIGLITDEIHAPTQLRSALHEISEDGLITNAKKAREQFLSVSGQREPEKGADCGSPRLPKHFLDLRPDPAIALDPVGAKDLDDLIYASAPDMNGNILVRVSFVNVEWRIREHSEVDRYATRLGQSLYAGGHILPLFGRDLSFGECSFVEGEDRHAFTAEMVIDRSGERRFTRVFPSLVKNHHALSYDLGQGILDGIPHPAAEVLQNCAIAAERLRSSRAKSKHHFLDVERSALGPNVSSYSIVEELMIASRQTIAEFCKDKRIPLLFRTNSLAERDVRRSLQRELRAKGIKVSMRNELTQPAAFARLLGTLREEGELTLFHKILGSYMGTSRYSAVPSPHRGLGVPLYTEPKGRHYAGLFNQRQLGQFFEGSTPKSFQTTSRRESGVNRNVRKQNDRRFLMMRFGNLSDLLEHRGEQLVGTVSYIQAGQVYVRLDEYRRRDALLLRPRVMDGSALSVGQEIPVVLRSFAPAPDRPLVELITP